MASNPYVNKVVKGTTTIIDISDTTAVAADVAQGKYFYTAAGQRVQGTGSGGGSSDVQVAIAHIASLDATSVSFSPLYGEPTSFIIISAHYDIATSSTPTLAALVYDGTGYNAEAITNTSNAQVSHFDTGFQHSYSNGILNVSLSNSTVRFQTGQEEPYLLMYTYGGTAGNVKTADVQVGSGATSITFSGLEDEPICWSCIFKSNFSTSSGYQRVICAADSGADIIGIAMDSSAHVQQSWTSSYSNGSLTITSSGTNNGGYFHQPGYYQLTYAVSGDQSMQTKTVTPTTSTQNVTADTGYTGLEKVVVNPIPSQYIVPTGNIAITSNTSGSSTLDVSQYATATVNVPTGGGGSVNVATTTWSNNSTSTVSHQFTGLLGTPKAAFLRCTSQLTRSSRDTYYYIADIVWDGTNVSGNYHLRSSGAYTNVASDATAKYNVTVGTNSITFSSTASSRSSAPGSFYNGTYELVYVY